MQYNVQFTGKLRMWTITKRNDGNKEAIMMWTPRYFWWSGLNCIDGLPWHGYGTKALRFPVKSVPEALILYGSKTSMQMLIEWCHWFFIQSSSEKLVLVMFKQRDGMKDSIHQIGLAWYIFSWYKSSMWWKLRNGLVDWARAFYFCEWKGFKISYRPTFEVQ